jgi:hypothetical protein
MFILFLLEHIIETNAELHVLESDFHFRSTLSLAHSHRCFHSLFLILLSKMLTKGQRSSPRCHSLMCQSIEKSTWLNFFGRNFLASRYSSKSLSLIWATCRPHIDLPSTHRPAVHTWTCHPLIDLPSTHGPAIHSSTCRP